MGKPDDLTAQQWKQLLVFSDPTEQRPPAFRRMSSLMRINLQGVQGHIEALVKKGYIHKEGYGQTAVYRATPRALEYTGRAHSNVTQEDSDG